MESCVDVALEKVNKGYNRKTIETFFNNFRDLGIKFLRINIISNLPGVTSKDISDIKKFVLDFADISKDFNLYDLFLSEKIDLGIHPEKYNIKILGIDNKNKLLDTLKYSMENELSVQERENMQKFFRLLFFSSLSALHYSSLNVARLMRTKIYSENNFSLFVKIGKVISFNSVFNEEGEKEDVMFTMPEKIRELNFEALFLFRVLDKFDVDKWYSIGDMVDIIGYSSKMERLKLMQRLFYGVLSILAGKGFADAKMEMDISQIN
jgi:hypothetical protein